jgi:hypothetical protein
LLLDFDVFNHTEMCVWADYISVMFGFGFGLVWFGFAGIRAMLLVR